jgi:hypothetical protein
MSTTTDQRVRRLDQVAQSAVSTLDIVAKLVEGAYGASSSSAALARQAYVHATLLLMDARILARSREGELRPGSSGDEAVRFEQAVESPLARPRARFDERQAYHASSLSRFAHEEIGEELKLVQREVTGLCVARRGRTADTELDQRIDTWLGKLDHLLRKLRNELDARALRELPRPGLSRAAGYYYGEPTHHRA